MIDFTDCQELPNDYGGADKKKKILYNGEVWMLKFSDIIDSAQKNEFNTSYSNNVFSEHLGSEIFKSVGILSQETLLGIYTDVSRRRAIKEYPVVACKNFNREGYVLYHFRALANSIIDIDMSGRNPKLENIEQIFSLDEEEFKKAFGVLDQKEAENRFWDNFIIDALIGNFDRHAENWGYLYNQETGDMKFAPVYDCGACFFPRISDDSLEDILSRPEEIRKRVYDYPRASLTQNGRKIQYYSFITSLQHEQCNAALGRMYPKIDLAKIGGIVDRMDGISPERKQFYKVILAGRYEKILKKAYKSLEQREPIEPVTFTQKEKKR